jgi:Tol biopolymer transport system component/predicted Ser/Thr protein kinase
MPLTPGTKLGPYEVQSPLGAGGMGEVYRALDTRLDRTVAIKVLAAHLSSSPELKQRMEREARAISSLNHPHICQLYDIGSQSGTDFLVMEFLEGQTLAERLRKGPIPLAEIYKIAIDVAEALAVAHKQGIVHRDLKPGNIMLTQSGAKLMDFGLAKPLSLPNAGSGSSMPPSFTAAATLSGPSPLSPLTTAGTIIGTIQYMSPEQIEGKEADARSDIFAFGSVLYEMTSGKRPFEGKSQLSLASSILEKDPDPISAVKPQIPPAFEHVITTCLQKNPEDRYQAAQDVKLELQWIAADGSNAAAAPAQSAAKPRPIVWIAAVVFALALGAITGFLLHHQAPAESIRTAINPPENTTLNLSGDGGGPPVLSPDGSSIAFAATDNSGKSSLWLRPMNSVDAQKLPDTEGAIFPFWSPDSRAVGFFTAGKLKTIDLNGGSVTTVCDATLGRGGSWSPEGQIVFSPVASEALYRVNATGGTPIPLTRIDNIQFTSNRWPFFLPDGKHFLYLALHHDPSKSSNNTIYYASLDGHENRPLFHSQSNAIFAAGYLLFARGDQLMAQPFDPDKGTLRGEPHNIAKGVMSDVSTWHMDASASANGTLIFGSGVTGDLQLVWLDRATKQITVADDKLPDMQEARISPQGDRIAIQIDSGINDIWVLDLARGVRTRLTFGPIANLRPVWSPDGKWIAYVSARNGQTTLMRKPADGSGAEEVLYTQDKQMFASDWSSDGKYILFWELIADNVHAQISVLPLEGEHKPKLLVARGSHPSFSPDGRYLVYQSSESGTLEVYVMSVAGQGKWQVSANGGQAPRWSRDGKEIYYFDTTLSLFGVPVKDIGSALQFGAPQNLVTHWTTTGIVTFDVSPDNKKILLENVSQHVSQSVTVVTNFTSGLTK